MKKKHIKKLKFYYKDIYELDLNLPMEIKKETVSAKFDKTKKISTFSSINLMGHEGIKNLSLGKLDDNSKYLILYNSLNII